MRTRGTLMGLQHVDKTAGAFFRTLLASRAVFQLEGVNQALLHGLINGLVLTEQPALLTVEAVAAAHAAFGFLDGLLR